MASLTMSRTDAAARVFPIGRARGDATRSTRHAMSIRATLRLALVEPAPAQALVKPTTAHALNRRTI
jgi:hypothetical protein